MPDRPAATHLLPAVRVEVVGAAEPPVLAACCARLDAVDPVDPAAGPFRLTVPAAAGIGRATVADLAILAESERLGVVLVLVPGLGPDAPVLLVRDDTRARAAEASGSGQPSLRELAETDGFRWVDGRQLKVEDLRSADPVRLVAPPWTPEGRAARKAAKAAEGTPADEVTPADAGPVPSRGGLRGTVRRWARGS